MPFNSFDAPEFNFPKDSLKSDKWVKMKADKIIKEQLKDMRSAEKEMKDMKIDLDVDQIRKELQEGLKDLDLNSAEFQNEMKEQQIEIDKQLKELSEENFAKEQGLQKKELEIHLKEIEGNTALNKKEKEQLKSELKETVERMNSKEFQDQLKKQLEDAKESLEQHRAKFESGEFENKLKEQRENIQQELKKIESPEFQEKINQQIKESKTKIQEQIKKVNSDEYRKELEESIKKSPETRKGLVQDHTSIGNPEKQPLIILDGKKITRAQMDQISPNEIASISVLKDEASKSMYGEEAKNGVILITRKSHDQETTSAVRLNSGDTKKPPLYILDGKKIDPEEMDKITHESIESLNVIKSEQAVEKYGKKGENGIIEITSKSHNSKNIPVIKIKGSSINNPLYIVDEKKISAKKAEKINPDDIESIDVLKGEHAIEKYGEEAKNGAVVIRLKE
jgi:TonB-dependent SusC/RagA subfamily outer membrane receptor